jgi:hypothetical protein
LKDRLGDQRGGSEWEPIKILLLRENSAYTPNSQPRIPTRVCQGHVVTTDVPTLETNPKRSQSGSTKQEAKDLAVLQQSRRTVRGHQVDCPRSPRGWSATYGGLSVKHEQNDPTGTSSRGCSIPHPRTVREQLVSRGQSATPERTVRQTPSHQKPLANRIETKALKNTRRTRRTPGPKGSTRTVHTHHADSPRGANKRGSSSLRANSRAPYHLSFHGSSKRLKLLRKDLGKM